MPTLSRRLGRQSRPRSNDCSSKRRGGGCPGERAAAMNALRGAWWLAVYLGLVLGPLFAMLVAPTPPGLGFGWEVATTMMGVQFVLTARFRRATAPYGIDIVYYFHRYLAVVTVGVILAHPVVLWVVEPALLRMLDPGHRSEEHTSELQSRL